MRMPSLLALALFATLAAPVSAQPNRAPARGETVRYMVLDGEILGDLTTDAILRETRQGGRVVGAVLDVCHSVSTTSARKDRFVVELRPEGGRLTGRAQSQEHGEPVTASLTRKQSGQSFSFEGTITRGAVVSTVDAPDNSDMSEAEFRETRASEEEIVAAPADFTQVAPIALGVRVKREAFLDFVRSLRGQGVKVGYSSLAPDCADLRAGHQMVRIEADAERAAQWIEKFKAAPGMIAAGWIAGSYGIERAVRMPAAPWRDAGKLDREKLAAALAEHIGKALSATSSSAAWDGVTGELTLTFKRPDRAVPGAGLTEILELTLLIGPEKLASGERMIVWIGDSAVATVDETAGPRLNLTGAEGGSDEEGTDIDVEAVQNAVARGLNGQLWDSGNSAWK
jgi:hypothetical protein